MHLESITRLVVAMASAPTRLPTRFAHSELVSFALFASLSRLQRRGVIAGIDAIIDVGANIGQFAFMASRIWPDLPIYSFEPDPDLFAQLEHTRERFGIKGRAYPFAAARECGTRELFRYELPTENSLLMRNDVASTESCRVDAVRLDEIDALHSATAPYFKLDIQGAELEALLGSTALLQRAAYVQVELSFQSSYRGASNPASILQLLDESGFRLTEILDQLRAGPAGPIQEMDWLFARR
jgi:FkbM family methyltransferase